MALLSRVKVLAVLAALTILILTLSILVVTRAPARAASQTSCSHTFVSSPNPGTSFNQLLGVSAIASNDAWAVGDFESSVGPSKTLIEHWNGVSWSVVPNPAANYPGFGGEFDGVAATNSRTVWTVGRSFNYTVDQTLTERWNGSRWWVLTNRTIGTRFSFLDAVSAIKVTSGPAVVWAVGEFENDSGPQQTLTELIVC